MVDFEDAQLWVRIAVGEGVEACSQENVLGDALGDRARQRVLGIAAAGDEKGAERNGKRAVRTSGRAAQLFGVGLAKDGNRDGVVENQRRGVVELVSGATQGYAECGLGGTRGLHALSGCHPGKSLCEVLLHLLARYDGVEEAVLQEKLGALKSLGEFLSDGLLDYARAG